MKAAENSIFMQLGASNHTAKERETLDYYATEPRAVELLLEKEAFSPIIWEPACGGGHISEVLEKHGYKVRSSDIVHRGYGECPRDFLQCDEPYPGDIVTNPPYSLALEFVKHALKIIEPGNKVAMLLKLQFLEGKKRAEFFKENPPAVVYISPSRLQCAKNGDFKHNGNNVQAYAWFVWVKGNKQLPHLSWLNAELKSEVAK